jgi:hypothetical protein
MALVNCRMTAACRFASVSDFARYIKPLQAQAEAETDLLYLL